MSMSMTPENQQVYGLMQRMPSFAAANPHLQNGWRGGRIGGAGTSAPHGITGASPFSAAPQGAAQQGQGQARPQPINPGNVLAGLNHDSKYNANSSSDTTNQAVKDLQAGTLAQNRANVNLGLETKNAALDMQDQANRSAAYQQALSNQSRINADLAQRNISQLDLATQLQRQMIENQLAFATSLLN